MTTEDKAHYDKLKKTEAAFQKWKHFLLWSGIIGAVVWPVIFFRLIAGLRDSPPESLALILSFSIPSFYAISAGSGVAIGIALKNWRGDPMRCLLLKLIDDKIKNEN